MILSLLRVKDFEMEDMMRSSFAEFHAQKQHPELGRAKVEALSKLAALRAKPWPSGPGRCAASRVATVLAA
jgi:superfamily II RNA helicase